MQIHLKPTTRKQLIHQGSKRLIIGFLTFFLLQPICSFGQKKLTVDAVPVGTLSSALLESSGIAVTHPNRIWSLNDSGNPNKIICIDSSGNVLRSITISNVENNDWEDMALDPSGKLYICDGGNNNNDRHNLKMLILPNPDQVEGNTVEAEIINYTFPDQVSFPPPQNNRNFDVEAIVWKYGYLYLFTKNRSTPQNGWCKLYRIPAVAGQYTACLMDSINLGLNDAAARVTSADINQQTGELVLLTARRIISFTNYVGDRFFNANRREYFFSSDQGQIEALQFYDKRKLYMTEEGSSGNPGKLYRINLDVVLGLDQQQKASLLEVFPNPSSGHFQVKTTQKGSFEATVYAEDGACLKKVIIKNGSFLDLSDLPAGKYFLTTIINKKLLRKQLLKR